MSTKRSFALVVCLLASSAAAVAAQELPVTQTLEERARGADRVVVGRVAAVSSVWQTNEFGDRLIVSILRVAVEETLKGESAATLSVEVEGGTIGELTLHVSDLTAFVPGERAVFYLRRSSRGTFLPHLRGYGLLKLNRENRVGNSSLTLDAIRRTVAAAQGRED